MELLVWLAICLFVAWLMGPLDVHPDEHLSDDYWNQP